MNCESTIQLLDLFEKTLHTREAANELLQIASSDPCNTVELDFAGIEYISRSFADQFHFNKLNLAQGQQKNIIVTNANEQVINMLQTVAKTQNKEHRGYFDIPVFKYSSFNQLENFLLSV